MMRQPLSNDDQNEEKGACPDQGQVQDLVGRIGELLIDFLLHTFSQNSQITTPKL